MPKPLTFAPGEPLDAGKLKALQRRVEANAPQRGGPGVRVTRKPWGWNATYSASSTYAPKIWRVNLAGDIEHLTLTIGRGLVSGVEPVISVDGKDVPIGGAIDPDTQQRGPLPEFSVPKEALDPKLGQGMLYLQASMSREWFLQKVTLLASATKPASQPFTAFKLLGFFILDGKNVSYQQMAFLNLGLGTLFSRTISGAARYVWYAV